MCGLELMTGQQFERSCLIPQLGFNRCELLDQQIAARRFFQCPLDGLAGGMGVAHTGVDVG